MKIDRWEALRYEVEISLQPKRVFYTEDEALRYIELNSDSFISMVKISTAVLEGQTEEDWEEEK